MQKTQNAGYLGRVTVESARVVFAFRALQLNFILALLDIRELWNLEAVADQRQKTRAIPQQFSTNALARAVNGDFNRRACKEQRGHKQAHTDGLAKAPRRADQDLLRNTRPVVLLQQPRIRFFKTSRWVLFE